MTMNKELQSWCADAQRELCAETETERKHHMIEFVNRHWILLNPLAVLIYAHIILAVVFALLGWEE